MALVIVGENKGDEQQEIENPVYVVTCNNLSKDYWGEVVELVGVYTDKKLADRRFAEVTVELGIDSTDPKEKRWAKMDTLELNSAVNIYLGGYAE